MLAKLVCRRSSHDQRCPASLPSKCVMDLSFWGSHNSQALRQSSTLGLWSQRNTNGIIHGIIKIIIVKQTYNMINRIITRHIKRIIIRHLTCFGYPGPWEGRGRKTCWRLVLFASSSPPILIYCLYVRGCYSGGSIPGRDEPGMRYISPYFNGYIGRFVTGKFKIHN